mmetsp:Transcript_86165/g.257167  ORF Transcript_86165/g.257167 Transcript_86165/m.257167 type:complete len:209 (+) Transcript_86165:62-688(+)
MTPNLAWAAAPETCWASSCSQPLSSPRGAHSSVSASAGGRHDCVEDEQLTLSWWSSRAQSGLGGTTRAALQVLRRQVASASSGRQLHGQSSCSRCVESPAPCLRWRSFHQVRAPRVRSYRRCQCRLPLRTVLPQMPLPSGTTIPRRFARSAASLCPRSCSCRVCTVASAGAVQSRSLGGRTGIATHAGARLRRLSWWRSRSSCFEASA